MIRQTLRVLRGTRRRLEQRAREQAIARRSPVLGSTRLTYAGPLEASEIVRRAARYPYWYHSFYLSNGAAIRGLYDVGADVAAYGFPTDMSGLNVLDVGMASGWFAFYLERLGASVTAVDVRTDDELDWYGRWQEPSPPTQAAVRHNEDGQPLYMRESVEPFWFMHELLESRVRFLNVSAYELSPARFDGRTFDLVHLGAILLHLRDPIGALRAARRVCHGQVIATTPVRSDIGAPAQAWLDPRPGSVAWWSPNLEAYRHWFLAAGFRKVDAEDSVIQLVDQPQTASEGADPSWRRIVLRVGRAEV